MFLYLYHVYHVYSFILYHLINHILKTTSILNYYQSPSRKPHQTSLKAMHFLRLFGFGIFNQTGIFSHSGESTLKGQLFIIYNDQKGVEKQTFVFHFCKNNIIRIFVHRIFLLNFVGMLFMIINPNIRKGKYCPATTTTTTPATATVSRSG